MFSLRALPLALALSFLAACSIRMQPAERARPVAPLPPLVRRPVPPQVYRWAHLDTLVLPGKRVLQLHPAAPTVYEQLPAPAWLITPAEEDQETFDLAAQERRRLRTAGPAVQRTGRSLCLRPAIGPPVRLLDNPAEDYETSVAYEYVAALSSIGQWLVSVHLYEGGYFMLVSQRTGRRTPVWSPPVVAPDSRHFVCGNFDVLARYEPSGLQVWQVDGPQLRLLWQRETEWGLNAPRWLDNRTILFGQDYFDNGDVDTRVMRLTVIP